MANPLTPEELQLIQESQEEYAKIRIALGAFPEDDWESREPLWHQVDPIKQRLVDALSYRWTLTPYEVSDLFLDPTHTPDTVFYLEGSDCSCCRGGILKTSKDLLRLLDYREAHYKACEVYEGEEKAWDALDRPWNEANPMPDETYMDLDTWENLPNPQYTIWLKAREEFLTQNPCPEPPPGGCWGSIAVIAVTPDL